MIVDDSRIRPFHLSGHGLVPLQPDNWGSTVLKLKRSVPSCKDKDGQSNPQDLLYSSVYEEEVYQVLLKGVANWCNDS